MSSATLKNRSENHILIVWLHGESGSNAYQRKLTWTSRWESWASWQCLRWHTWWLPGRTDAFRLHKSWGFRKSHSSLTKFPRQDAQSNPSVAECSHRLPDSTGVPLPWIWLHFLFLKMLQVWFGKSRFTCRKSERLLPGLSGSMVSWWLYPWRLRRWSSPSRPRSTSSCWCQCSPVIIRLHFVFSKLFIMLSTSSCSSYHSAARFNFSLILYHIWYLHETYEFFSLLSVARWLNRRHTHFYFLISVHRIGSIDKWGKK